jgi:mono/diheme cytochrome c family protein
VDLTPASYRGLTNPLQGDADAIAAGKPRFQTYCAACHGLRGDARGAVITATGRPADFTDGQQASFLTDGYAFWRTKEGGHQELRSQMPAYKQHFTDEQIWQLVAYIQSLAPPHTWGMDWLTARFSGLQAARMTFAAKNCTACHALNGLGGTVAPDLAATPVRRDEAWRTEHFRNPTAALPTFKMIPPREPSPTEIEGLKDFLRHLRDETAAKNQAGSTHKHQ